MKSRSTTPDRILDASRRLFNDKGYAATTLTEIAASIGISQGNLTYHFPTKRHIAARLEEEVEQRGRNRRATQTAGAIEDDYVEHLLFGTETIWQNRFLLRDRAQYADIPLSKKPQSEIAADFDELQELLGRIKEEGMFRRDIDIDLPTLTRSLWIISRYWMDYLNELEGQETITLSDKEQAVQQHFAVLLPSLTAAARRAFEAALARATVKS